MLNDSHKYSKYLSAHDINLPAENIYHNNGKREMNPDYRIYTINENGMPKNRHWNYFSTFKRKIIEHHSEKGTLSKVVITKYNSYVDNQFIKDDTRTFKSEYHFLDDKLIEIVDTIENC